MDLCLSACILMWSYELVKHCKHGACPKYLMSVVANLWLGYAFNVRVYLVVCSNKPSCDHASS